MSEDPFGVAIVGCGVISNQYLKSLTRFPDVKVVFCADLDTERARKQADEYGVPDAGSVEQALARDDVRLVVNLTIPKAHADVALGAIEAGKHVWNEKPLTLDVASATKVMITARNNNVRVGCAPDTVLGAGIQSARRLIDSGAIGTPLSALILFQSPGPESWHPDPEFLFAAGAGPLYDIGPYYLSTLATMFGPARRVAAVSRRARDTRVIGSGPRQGTRFGVEVPTYTSALVEYEAGQAAQLLFTWDSALKRNGFCEITGTEATLAVPDPNRFDGDLKIRRAADDDWTVIPSEGAAAGRGSGVLDMARAIAAGTPHRASGEMALHVLELMEKITSSGVTGSFESITSTFDTPAPLDAEWDPYAAAL